MSQLKTVHQGGGNSIDYVIGSNVSTVEGGFWQDTINDAPVLKLRHGDYEYNFQYDSLTRVSDNDTAAVTVTPDTYVLGTASVSSEGGVWYEINSNNVPQLKLHKGNYNYGFNYDSITYKGDNSYLVAYLPFETSTTADACGNEWTVTGSGSPQIVDNACSFDGLSYLANSTISASIGAQLWTIDFWATANPDASVYAGWCGTFGDINNTSWVCITWTGGTPQLHFNAQYYSVQRNLSANTRYHYAITYDGTNIRAFINGNLGYTATRSVSLSGNFLIGSRSDGQANISGSIDHFRIFSGIALWTSNFTPPTANDYA